MLRVIALALAVVTATTCFAESHTTDQTCHLKTTDIRVDYMEERRAPNGEILLRRPIILYRYQHQVAIEYPAQGITEKWERAKNKRIKLTRYFNDARRGIEYQPGELTHTGLNGVRGSAANTDWSMHWQLISDDLIASMTAQQHGEIKDSKHPCETPTIYHRDTGSSQSKLIWLPTQQLVESYSLTQPAYTLTLTRAHTPDIHDADIASYFATLSEYPTIDYADIGDSESDPFLLKMINLGFVEHGASGFYDAQGNDIGARRDHNH